jgi:hypothetical protein
MEGNNMTTEKPGFKIICKQCGSEDISIRGVDYGSVYIYCNKCDNEE